MLKKLDEQENIVRNQLKSTMYLKIIRNQLIYPIDVRLPILLWKELKTADSPTHLFFDEKPMKPGHCTGNFIRLKRQSKNDS